jgi:hypothetical protein
MITGMEPVGYNNIGCGAAEEKFNVELEKVLRNIQDPNTPWNTAREITLKVIIKPEENRIDANIVIEAKSKLAPQKIFPSKIFIGKDVAGKPEAHEINSKDMPLFPKPEENVKTFRKEM